ncbi:MAG: TolC family protein [Rickettsiales bacterium]|nr:TolC family protein [Rickettsiales bacterium]
MKKIINISLIVLLSSCSLYSEEKSPKADYEKWAEAEINAKGRADIEWWNNYNDSTLKKLIEKAKENNFDIKIAKTRIVQSRANANKVIGDNLPNIDLINNANRRKDSTTLADRPILRKFSNNYRSELDATWEVDIFGIEPAIRASEADIAKNKENLSSVQIALFGDVANNYFDYRKFEKQSEIENRKLAELNKKLSLLLDLERAGRVDASQIEDARIRIADTKTNLTNINNNLKQQQFTLESLVGVKPNSLKDLLSEKQNNIAISPKILVSAPAEILSNRPDVRLAERELAYSNALKDVAITDLFPRISIGGVLGYESGRESLLIDPKSEVFRLSGGLIAPIFNYNRIKSNIMEADAKAKEALINYEKTLNNALIDVEGGFVSYKASLDNLISNKSAFNSSKSRVLLEQEKFNKGLTNYVAVADAKIIELDNQVKLDNANFESLKQSVKLYKALGGGWI